MKVRRILPWKASWLILLLVAASVGVVPTLALAATCTVTGTDGNDVFVVTGGGETYCGLGGTDTLDLSNSPVGLCCGDPVGGIVGPGQIDADGHVYGWGDEIVFTGIEKIIGTDYPDWLQGGSGGIPRTFVGRAGADYIDTWGQPTDPTSTYLGGDGADLFLIRNEREINIVGGNGVDTLDFRYTFDGVRVNLGSGIVEVGGSSNLTFVVEVENVAGSRHDDFLVGADGSVTSEHRTPAAGRKSGANVISGRAGDDVIVGKGGDDKLNGRRGRDSLNGGDGWDRCVSAVRRLNCERG